MWKNKTLIGAFVFGSIILVCLAFILLGYGKFGLRHTSFALFFDSSLRGLSIDSPVYFKGVPIGSVRSIYIVPFSSGSDNFKTVVIIELKGDVGGIDSMTDTKNFIEYMDNENYVKTLIGQGLRAKLSTASLITGQLVIELAMISDPAPVAGEQMQKFNNLMQIPTLPNVFDSIMSSVENLPIKDISSQLLLLLENINNNLTALHLPELGVSIQLVADNLNKLEIDAQSTLNEFANIAKTLNVQITPILKNLNVFAKNSSSATQEDSALMQELFITMQSLREAANSISYLARLLENQPDALIFGKAK